MHLKPGHSDRLPARCYLRLDESSVICGRRTADLLRARRANPARQLRVVCHQPAGMNIGSLVAPMSL